MRIKTMTTDTKVNTPLIKEIIANSSQSGPATQVCTGIEIVVLTKINLKKMLQILMKIRIKWSTSKKWWNSKLPRNMAVKSLGKQRKMLARAPQSSVKLKRSKLLRTNSIASSFRSNKKQVVSEKCLSSLASACLRRMNQFNPRFKCILRKIDPVMRTK
jgi:hypothetical protein